MHSKAAAVLTNHAAEVAALQSLRRQNEESSTREQLRILVDELAEIDLDEIREARRVLESAAQLE